MTRKLISSGSPFEPTIGFSRAVRIGGLICVAGTAPIAADGSTVGVGDAVRQAERCLEIIQAALVSAGAGLDNVIRTRVMLTRIEDWASVAQVHGQAFAGIRPACTVFQVLRFIDPQWLVEIEADAFIA
jgi:enamine deaminase RidA (YjgF/YER057c/UK114 family)